MARYISKCIAAIVVVTGVLTATPSVVHADTVFSNLRFSKDEVELLRTIDQIEDAAGVTSSLLKATPFIQLLASLDPKEMAITVATNEWERIGPALKALGTIKACKISGEITLFLAENGTNRAKNPNRAFFTRLQQQYGGGC